MFLKKIFNLKVQGNDPELMDIDSELPVDGKVKVVILLSTLSKAQIDELVKYMFGSREIQSTISISNFFSNIIKNKIGVDTLKCSHLTVNGFDTIRVYNLKDGETYELTVEVTE